MMMREQGTAGPDETPRSRLTAIEKEFGLYKDLTEKTLRQITDEQLNWRPTADANSIGMLIRHLSGNFKSRFTDFLTTDGEKPWRNRDDEFETRDYARDEVQRMWQDGWAVFHGEVGALSDDDLARVVTIRGVEWTVESALIRSIAHLGYHAGQIVLMARSLIGDSWDWLSVPKGGSLTYNADPNRERRP